MIKLHCRYLGIATHNNLTLYRHPITLTMIHLYAHVHVHAHAHVHISTLLHALQNRDTNSGILEPVDMVLAIGKPCNLEIV